MSGEQNPVGGPLSDWKFGEAVKDASERLQGADARLVESVDAVQQANTGAAAGVGSAFSTARSAGVSSLGAAGGSLVATFADIELMSQLVSRHVSTTVVESGRVLPMSTNGDLLESLVLSPVTGSMAQGAVLTAAGRLAAHAALSQGLSIVAVTIVSTYQLADTALQVGAASMRFLSTTYDEIVSGLLGRASGEWGWEGHDGDALLVPAGVDAGDPHAVAQWWSSLTDPEKVSMIEAHPLVVGNLNGVPFADRIAANRVGAQNYLESGMTLSEDERRYLESVIGGERQLVLFDPVGERIIELEGTLTAETHTLLTYVPGTDTNMTSFYNDASLDLATQSQSVQQVARYLVNRDLTGGTVALIYKDGPWVVWPWVDGDRGNNNNEFLGQKGDELASFQRGMSTDSMIATARPIAIAHSAGMTIVGESEVSGARYSQVHSLAGSYLPDAWSPKGDTTYTHYQYGSDAINALDGVMSQTPNTSAAFDRQPLAADVVRVPFGPEINDPLESHSRIARGPADVEGVRGNTSGLEAIRERIRLE